MESGKHELRDSVEIDVRNWDQPLIIAEPDIEVRFCCYRVLKSYNVDI